MEEKRMKLIELLQSRLDEAIEIVKEVAELNLELQKRMETEIVTFYFQKNDGTIRKAVGTMRRDMTPEIKGTGKPLSEHLQLYFDVEKGAFRSFKKECLISIEE